MNRQQAFEQLAVAFDLKPADFYFLDLIPLIEMVWADGQNQPAELDILYKFAIEHIAYLDRQSGIRAVSIADANDFLERFALRKPSAKLLQELRTLACISAGGSDNPRGKTILESCLDIAAACTTHYPFSPQERIMDEEKKLLEKLFREFHIDPDTMLSDSSYDPSAKEG